MLLQALRARYRLRAITLRVSLCGLRRAGWATLGALPLIPHQGTSRCSIVALRPIGLIACFAPRLRVAVPATGRAPLWRSGPSTFTQNHAAVSARPRSARTLRVSLCGLWPHTTGTLGGRCPPKTPCQEPEVPGPPGLCSKPCSRVSSSALRANIARFFMRPLAAHAGLR